MGTKLEGFAEIDGLPEKYYSAFCDLDDRWNRWHKPEFDLPTVTKIMQDLGGQMRMDAETGEIQVMLVDQDEWDPVILTQGGRYIFDGWTWEFTPWKR